MFLCQTLIKGWGKGGGPGILKGGGGGPGAVEFLGLGFVL